MREQSDQAGWGGGEGVGEGCPPSHGRETFSI